MLELRNISKEYKTGAEVVHALRGIDLAFRRSEFVSILGPSGCGKTTMLNILGGLDQYTDGDLIIDGISTKEYKDADWDAYRNDTIGFVFQSYNLISHQTVLANVELALTLSGVSPAERRRRAVAALEQVGLGDQINKKPAQMSGGQVQRVAIARALINDPDIILADEPTGALDSETSIQIMSILKDISTRKLVIMVTHNPELAEEYSTRIVRLSDGQVISDSDPYVPGSAPAAGEALSGFVPAASVLSAMQDSEPGMQTGDITAGGTPDQSKGAASPRRSKRARRRRNKSMSMATALHLSLNNLMTKKARTLLTAFAGSIGIIGIALILSVSSGFQDYIDKLEEDTLSSYPLQIQSETADMTSMITAFAASDEESDDGPAGGTTIKEQQVMSEMLGSIGSNDLEAFRDYLESNMTTIGKWFNYHEYSYGISPTIYSTDMKYGPLRVSPGSIMQSYMNNIQTSMISYANTDVFFQMMDNRELLESQYDVIAGEWPDEYNELLLVLQHEDELNDYIVYTLGLRDPQELKDMINDVMKGKEVTISNKPMEWDYDDFIGKEFSLVNACDLYRRNDSYNVWEDMSDDDDYMKDLIRKGEKIHISGIVCPKDPNGANAMSMGIGYLPSLTDHMIKYAKKSEIVKIQREMKNTDVFSGKSFEDIRNKTDEGLGFEDMISIDSDKLASALGGNLSASDLENIIKKITMDTAKELSKNDTPEEIIDQVMKELSAVCSGMADQLMEMNPTKVNDDAIDKALADNLKKDKNGKHYAVVKKLAAAYADALKKALKSLPAIDTSKLPGSKPSGGSSGKPDQGQSDSSGDGGSETSDETGSGSGDEGGADGGQDDGSGDGSSQDGGSAGGSSDGSGSGDEGSGDGGSDQGGTVPGGDIPSVSPLALIIPKATEEFLESKELKAGLEPYAKGIKMMQDAGDVGPALGKISMEMGKMFKVDPAGIASAFTMKMDEEELTRLITAYMSGNDDSSYEANLRKLGYADHKNPASMSFYLKDFESKEKFLAFIDDYNKDMQDRGEEDLVISYTDLTGIMMKSVKTITNAVSYVLIAFVAISLIVSSIMIGVITYISVLERTKEIGILRAIGASKKDISRIFNAETIIVGLCAGIIGIGASLLLLIPINSILLNLTKIKALRAVLPLAGGAILILISIFLTFIAGLIPSGMAARKDPVVALRTE